MNSITNKKDKGNVIKEYYENQQYDKIEEYIKDEAEAFIELYGKVKKNIDEIL